jgi:hypothetical protein
VQNNDSRKNKFPLTVISGSTTESYPFQVPTCDIEVVSNSRKGTSGYATPIKADDFVRLQVSTQITPRKWTIWQDLFVGQIQSAHSVFGDKNTLNLHCVGFMDEVNWSAVNTHEWAVETDARAVFQYYLSTANSGNGYRRYLTYNANYCLSGATVPSFNTNINQTFMAEVVNSMEEQSGYTYRASAVPVFDSGGNVDTVYLSWKPLSSTVTSKYAVIENTSRVISSEFASSIEELRNRDVMIGSSASGAISTVVDSTSKNQYGERTRIDTLNWINTVSQCNNTATKIVGYAKNPPIYGSATLILTPNAHPGDLVYCKAPSQEVNGETIDQNLIVYRVRHDFPGNTTTLDLGRVNLDAYDYIGMMRKELKNLKNNIAKS